MNITASKVKKKLESNYGWLNMSYKENEFMINELIKDTISVINDILQKEKGITIKNK